MRRFNHSLLLCIAAAALTSGLFFHQSLFSGQTFFFRDIHRWFYPMKSFLGNAISAGDFPAWSSHYFCGAPFLSDIQSGVFYPPSLLLAAAPSPLAFNLFVVFHFCLAFIGCFLFSRAIGLHSIAALFTAVSYSWGGFLISSVNTLNNLTTAAWLPVVLLSFHAAATGRRLHLYCVAVLLTSLCLLGGEPQLFLMIVGLSMCFCFWQFTRMSSEKGMSFVWHSLPVMAILAGVLALCMVQIGPLWLDYRQSARLAGLSYDAATRHSLELKSLVHLVVPVRFPSDFVHRTDIMSSIFPTHEKIPWLLSVYPGMLCVPLAVYGLFVRRATHTRFWVVAFAIPIVLALGNNTPVYRLFYWAAPFFRFPEKFLMVSGFALIMLAGGGMDNLLRRYGRSALVAPFAAILPLVAFLDLWSANFYLNPVVPDTFYKRHYKDYRPVLSDTAKFRVYVDNNLPPIASPDAIMDHHLRWQSLLLPNLGILHGLDHVDGKSGLELNYQWFITELLMRPWEEKITFLRLANVKYIISPNRLDTVEALRGQVERVNPIVYRLRHHMPRAWLAGRAVPADRAGPELLGRNSIDFNTSVYVSGNASAPFGQPYHAQVDRLVYVRNGEIHATVNSDRPAVLMLSETYYPGWRVLVDGHEKQVLKLNYLFQGVAVDPGRHEVVFVYRPPYFSLFMSISVGSICVLAVLLGCCVKQSKPETPGRSG